MMKRMAAVLAATAIVSGCGSAPNSAPAGTDASVAKLSLSKFNQLKTGMSLAQANAIIGFPGTEQSSNEIAGTKTAMYAWADASGIGNMNAMFQNDKLMSKAQFGLQ